MPVWENLTTLQQSLFEIAVFFVIIAIVACEVRENWRKDDQKSRFTEEDIQV